MRWMFWLVLFIFISMIYVGSVWHKNEIEYDLEPRNFTKIQSEFSWNSSRLDDSFKYENNPEAGNLARATLNYFGTAIMEVSKWGLRFGYENHDKYNFNFLFNLFKWFLYIAIFCTLIPVIAPISALFYLIWIGIKKIFVKFKS